MNRLLSSRFKRWAAIVGVIAMLASFTGPGVPSVQAGMPAGIPVGKAVDDYYFAFAGFMTPDPGGMCIWKKMPIEGYVAIISRWRDGTNLAPLEPLSVSVTITARLGKVSRGKFAFPQMWVDKVEILPFVYSASKAGHEVITIKATWNGKPAENKLEFEVTPCKYKVHGTADFGPWSARQAAENPWKLVGTYDISGTVVADEDGIHGEGSGNAYLDALFTGGEDGITRTHTPPWQGSSGVEMDGDLAQLKDNGTLDLQVQIQPLSINSTVVACSDDDGGGSVQTPPMNFASFDLDLSPIPVDGGSTSLEFTFPGGTAPVDMEFDISPEAQS